MKTIVLTVFLLSLLFSASAFATTGICGDPAHPGCIPDPDITFQPGFTLSAASTTYTITGTISPTNNTVITAVVTMSTSDFSSQCLAQAQQAATNSYEFRLVGYSPQNPSTTQTIYYQTVIGCVGINNN